jgi:alpha-beta hydrolase superfamily lysophospholipase
MNSPTPKKHGLLRWVLDVAMLATVLPVVAAAGFCVFMAYRIYHPARKRGRREPRTSMPIDRARIASSGGLKLAAWIARHPRPKGAVVICHEWGAHKGAKVKYAEFLHEAGYDVVLFDLRNHGESDSDPAWGQMSRRFTDDLEAVLAFVAADPSMGERPIAVLSFSFSTFPALHCRAHRAPKNVRALVLDSGPGICERDVTRRFLENVGRLFFPVWLRGPIMFPIGSALIEYISTALLAVVWPPPLEGVDTPMLFVCGGADPIMPLEAVQPLADLVAASRVWVVPDSPHLLAFKVQPDEYRQEVVQFLDDACTDRLRRANP